MKNQKNETSMKKLLLHKKISLTNLSNKFKLIFLQNIIWGNMRKRFAY